MPRPGSITLATELLGVTAPPRTKLPRRLTLKVTNRRALGSTVTIIGAAVLSTRHFRGRLARARGVYVIAVAVLRRAASASARPRISDASDGYVGLTIFGLLLEKEKEFSPPQGGVLSLNLDQPLTGVQEPQVPCDVVEVVGDSGPLIQVLGTRRPGADEPPFASVAGAGGMAPMPLLSDVLKAPCDDEVVPALASAMNVPPQGPPAPWSCSFETTIGSPSGSRSSVSYVCSKIPGVNPFGWTLHLLITVPAGHPGDGGRQFDTASGQPLRDGNCTIQSADSTNCTERPPSANENVTQWWNNMTADHTSDQTSCNLTIDLALSGTPPGGGAREPIISRSGLTATC
jgi:hypothetical protein